ncbi:RimJ/RimL family protein N-acetyltransferase [Stackebrandtia endophytica]|uniref:RimJ/RimL family protein N-acetyltransferase n=1 Tax=Stackebrandtia endophytica TaxID=1496996 RepID=A0A543AQX6_9ACTN|nr:GNAT family protein [Stackebrandtia endophytica]TQL74980.1 RimJ/RimL family protein N-acetyltransferase [Stackebrandtia endophytica]
MRFDRQTPLVLRPWRRADAPAVLAAFSALDMAQQAGEPIVDLASANRWLDWACGKTTRQTGFVFAVTAADDVPVGNIAVTNVDTHDCAWVSYWVASAARGCGVAADSLAAMVPWVHDVAGIYRLELGHRVNNPASGGVARRAGFISEGVERAKLCYGGERFDVESYARLSTDPRIPPRREVVLAVDAGWSSV